MKKIDQAQKIILEYASLEYPGFADVTAIEVAEMAGCSLGAAYIALKKEKLRPLKKKKIGDTYKAVIDAVTNEKPRPTNSNLARRFRVSRQRINQIIKKEGLASRRPE